MINGGVRPCCPGSRAAKVASRSTFCPGFSPST
jgi:hypothetical protein